MKAGSEGKPIVFLFADTQIKSESFMEDISMILNTGDVPNLFAADEKAELIEKMQTIARNEVKHLGCFSSPETGLFGSRVVVWLIKMWMKMLIVCWILTEICICILMF